LTGLIYRCIVVFRLNHFHTRDTRDREIRPKSRKRKTRGQGKPWFTTRTTSAQKRLDPLKLLHAPWPCLFSHVAPREVKQRLTPRATPSKISAPFLLALSRSESLRVTRVARPATRATSLVIMVGAHPPPHSRTRRQGAHEATRIARCGS
jgi:hypothetical protein